MSISILDYGAGNLRSITNLMDYLAFDYKIIKTPTELDNSHIVILPGVGHFGQLMDHLSQKNLNEPLKNHILSGKPYLGICLGLQILFESSEEAPNKKGLSIFKGNISRFTKGKVPQIGWNKLEILNNSPILQPGFVYFVNSYCLKTEEEAIIAAKTNYYDDFISAIQKDKLLAVQFHPEKSGEFGCNIVKRWIEYVI